MPIRFAYYDDTDVAIQSFVSTLVAAEKYVRSLSKALIDQIKSLNGNEICILLKHREHQRLNNKDLQRELTKKQQMETKAIIDSDGFLSLSVDTVKELLSNEMLSVDEGELFDAVLKWAKHQCLVQPIEMSPTNLRRIMSRLAHLFAYPSMSLKEFANGPGKLRILNDTELVNLFLHFTLKGSTNCLPKHLFASRKPTLVYEVSLLDGSRQDSRRDSKDSDRYSASTAGEFVDFKTNGEIYLRGLQISVQMNEKEKKLTLHKRSTDQLELISSKTITTSCFDSLGKSNGRIEFDYPVLIRPNINYRLELRCKDVKYWDPKWMTVKASWANVEFVFTGTDRLVGMEKLIFHKFG